MQFLKDPFGIVHDRYRNVLTTKCEEATGQLNIWGVHQVQSVDAVTTCLWCAALGSTR